MITAPRRPDQRTLERADIDAVLDLVAERAAIVHPSRDLAGPSGGGDIDCLVEGLDPMWPLRLTDGWRLCQRIRYDVTASSWLLDRDGRVIAIDTLEDRAGLGQYGIPTRRLLPERGTTVGDAEAAAYLTAKRLRKGIGTLDEWRRIARLASTNPQLYTAIVSEVLGSGRGHEVASRVLAYEVPRNPNETIRNGRHRGFLRRGLAAVRQIGRAFERLVHPTGLYVVLVGPDGVGKSTVASKLPAATLGLFRRSEHGHWRPGILPRPGALLGRGATDSTAPHAEASYGRVTSLALTLYHWADFVIGGWSRIHPMRIRSGLVVVERGWWDLVVDPRRYRLRIAPWIVRALGIALPRPDLIVVLEGDGRVLHARKPELGIEELERQRQRWREMTHRGAHALYVDVERGSDAVVAETRRTIVELLERRALRRVGAGWVAVPSRRAARWTLPRGPRSDTKAALSIYQPVTRVGRIGWLAARSAATVGAWRVMPRAAPEPAVRELLAPYVPRGATIAVARAQQQGKRIAMIVRDGRVVAVAKVALDDPARLSLSREAVAYRDVVPHLVPPVRAPRLLARSEDVLVFEPITTSIRRTAHDLPIDVARALGSLYRSIGADGQSAFTHGDVAPWNILRSREGWVLVDWEDAAAGGAPFWDISHHVVQAHALLGAPSADAITRGVEGQGILGATFDAYAEAASLPRTSACEYFVEYLRSSITTMRCETPDERAGIQARHDLLVAIEGGRR